jgi:hypothetical protein
MVNEAILDNLKNIMVDAMVLYGGLIQKQLHQNNYLYS